MLRSQAYLHVKETRKAIPIMPPGLALWLTLINSNYPCLEHIFMVPEVFEPLKFYCMLAWGEKDTCAMDFFSR